MNGDNLSRIDLHSHANMVIVGKHAAIINDTGRRGEVYPFTQDYGSLSRHPNCMLLLNIITRTVARHTF